jgi:hypothetical protein
MAYLIKSLREEEPRPAIELAVFRFSEFFSLRRQKDDLRKTLESRKLIEPVKVMVQARVTAEIAAGVRFLPFHYGRDEGFFKAANNLTLTARDPVSRQPELKACAVRERKIMDFPQEDN